MSEQRTGGPFDAVFTYTEAVLSDFETLYLQKKEISPATRVALGLVGAAGAVKVILAYLDAMREE